MNEIEGALTAEAEINGNASTASHMNGRSTPSDGTAVTSIQRIREREREEKRERRERAMAEAALTLAELGECDQRWKARLSTLD